MTDNTISQKINNFAYAPGIATYGGSGATGAPGEMGNCIFFTSFNILGGEDLPEFKQAMVDNKLPIKDGTEITRIYQNGDYFFDSTGAIFRIHDIEKLKSYPLLSDNYQVYFTLCGQIKSNNDANAIFSTTNNSNRISLNSKYSGVDINNTSSDIPDSDNNAYALRIFADNSNKSTGDIEILHATPFYNFNDDADFRIYYDSNLNLWHVSSEVPVVIDSEVTVNPNTGNNKEGYSSVITSDTPITNFYNFANKITYKCNKYQDKTQENPIEIKLVIPDDLKMPKYSDSILIKLTNNENQSVMYNFNRNKTVGLIMKLENPVIMTVSLIYNIEVFLQNNDTKTAISYEPEDLGEGINVADYVHLFDLGNNEKVPAPTINNSATFVRVQDK